MSYLIISASLNPKSRSCLLAREALSELTKLGYHADWIDLVDEDLPLCDGDSVFEDERVVRMRERITRAEGILLAVPVYNFYASAAAKNLLELAGNAWKEKVVGFLCAAGGKASYMGPVSLANSLMLDFRCWIVPRFVYALGTDFEGEKLTDSKIRERIFNLVVEWVRLVEALRGTRSKTI
jgi:FMN reductase